MIQIDPEFWRGKRVLLTGATGFKGSWLTIWLETMGAELSGLGLAPSGRDLFCAAGLESTGNHAILDIRRLDDLAAFVSRADPEIVFHLAAQPLVRASYDDPVGTFDTNVMGTVNLLEACRPLADLAAVVVITTDKVYSNLETVLPYREEDRLGGHDPYSASKAACEIAVESYRRSFLGDQGVAVATARAGNVIGGGDWSADRLLPDAVRAWSSNETLVIRNPTAVRPWQHVVEPLGGYLKLAQNLVESPWCAGAYNFGPLTNEAADVGTVVSLADEAFGKGAVRFGDEKGAHEAGLLTLETAKARAVLGHAPRWDLAESVGRTMRWYRRFLDGQEARRLCEADLDDWLGAA